MPHLFECDHCGEIRKERYDYMCITIGGIGFGAGEYCRKCKRELMQLVHKWAGNVDAVEMAVSQADIDQKN